MASIVILQVAWLVWFLAEPLPNAGNVGGRGLCRYDLMMKSVPHAVRGLRLRESHLGVALERLSHVENLHQRIPIVLGAALIASAAVATGRLGLRVLGLIGEIGRWERVAVAYGLGASGLGVATLIVGRLGLLSPGIVRSGLIVPIAAELGWTIARWLDRLGPTDLQRWSAGARVGFLVATGPFLLIMFLGAMLPTIDFDATEYHLQAPKEYFQAGRIAFLPHNVYASMPFGVEMLHLLGMEVVGDWWLGALVGQVLVSAFAPATAVLIAGVAGRVGSPRAAWVAGVVYLTAPWVHRLAVLPYVEGPLCFYHAALIWVVCRPRHADSPDQIRWFLLSGSMAGAALGTKYPGLISAVIPFGLVAMVASARARSWRPIVAFGLGAAIVAGPWLVKNGVDAGNPVYPLGYRVFGGRDWDEAREAQWAAAHGPKAIEASAFGRSIVDVLGRSDWQSPLFAALAPLALLRPGRRRQAGWLWGYVASLFLYWWLLTHRLDRFWTPILPPLAILAGLGADWSRSRIWSGWLVGLMTIGIGLNATYCSTDLAGLNEWLGDLAELRTGVPALLNPPLARLDAELPEGARPLLVGQAAAFHVNHPVVYNTVFDRDTFEQLARGRSPAEIRDGLARLGVTHIYVDWSEIGRYRSPGNYGFTTFVTPEVFARQVDAGVLGPPARLGPKHELYKVEKP